MKKDINNLNFRPLNSRDIDSLMELQDTVFASLDNPDLFRRNEREMFLNSIAGDGRYAIGAYDPDKDAYNMIAVGIAVDATGTPEDLNHDLVNYENGKIDGKTINMKNTMVSPDYRGIGLQRELISRLHNQIKNAGYEYAIATVHPDNRWSVDNLEAEGYKYDHNAAKYGGLKRSIYVKKLQ